MNVTRFEQEISGSLGEFWKQSATNDLNNITREIKENSVIDSDGAIYWKSNGNYIPEDVAEKLEYVGYEFNRTVTAEKREAQQKEQIAYYKKNKKPTSREDITEMRAAFGTGSTIVDIITGERIIL